MNGARPGTSRICFLTDGAVFVSNADKNPTLTIMALAWRALGSHRRHDAEEGVVTDRRTTIQVDAGCGGLDAAAAAAARGARRSPRGPAAQRLRRPIPNLTKIYKSRRCLAVDARSRGAAAHRRRALQRHSAGRWPFAQRRERGRGGFHRRMGQRALSAPAARIGPMVLRGPGLDGRRGPVALREILLRNSMRPSSTRFATTSAMSPRPRPKFARAAAFFTRYPRPDRGRLLFDAGRMEGSSATSAMCRWRNSRGRRAELLQQTWAWVRAPP